MQSDNLTVAQKATTDLLDRGGVGAMAEAKIRQSLKSPDDGPKNHIYIGFLNVSQPSTPAEAPAVYGNTVVWAGHENLENYKNALKAERKAASGDDDPGGDIIDVSADPDPAA